MSRHARPAAARRRRAAALVVAASAAVPVVLFGWTGAAHAQAPDDAAWWNAANLGDPAPQPPAPPDVKSGDLFVEGSNAAPAGPLGAGPAGAQAIAGVSFDLQPSDVIGALTLTVDGTPPPQVSVVACKATSTFTSATNAPWSQAPGYDATKCVSGKLDGTHVVFDGVSDLVDNARLTVVILPGPLDRVVFAAPTDSTLAVQHGTGIGAAAPPLGAGVGPAAGPAGAGGGPGPAGPASGGNVVAPAMPSGPLPGAAATSGSGSAPVVAGAPTTGAVTPQATRPVASTGGLSTGVRRGLALGVIALEALGFVLLVGAGDGAHAAGVLAGAGGRLRPPDRAVPRAGRADAAGRADPAGGVGRFRRPRTGRAPQL